MVTYEKLKTKENFRLLAQKVIAVAYVRWSLTRGSKYSDLTWELLVFWKTGCRGELVATGGSTVSDNLFLTCSGHFFSEYKIFAGSSQHYSKEPKFLTGSS